MGTVRIAGKLKRRGLNVSISRNQYWLREFVSQSRHQYDLSQRPQRALSLDLIFQLKKSDQKKDLRVLCELERFKSGREISRLLMRDVILLEALIDVGAGKTAYSTNLLDVAFCMLDKILKICSFRLFD